MTSIVSNGLSFLAAKAAPLLETASTTAATTAASGPAKTPFLNGLMAVGVCILAVYIVRRILAPRKLLLARTPGRPNNLTPAWGLGLLALMILQQGGAAALLQIWLPQKSAAWAIGATLLSQLAFLPAVIWAAIMTFPLGLERGLGLSVRHWFYDSLRAVIAFLAVLPVCLELLSIMSHLIYGSQPPPEHILLEALRNATVGGKLLAVVSVCVLAPLAEEIFFRGIFQTMLRKYLKSPWAAVILTSCLFALVHPTPTQVPLFALSVVLGYNYERTGRLMPPVLIHMLFNIVSTAEVLSGGS